MIDYYCRNNPGIIIIALIVWLFSGLLWVTLANQRSGISIIH